MKRAPRILLLAVLGWASTAAAGAQVESARVWVLPFEVDSDYGAANGDAIIGRFLPLNTIYLTKKLNLVNLAIVTIADTPGGRPGDPGNPEPVPGPRVFGLSDITDAVLLAPRTPGRLLWGLGVGVGIPTATDDVLGSGKWLAGPAFRLASQAGTWRLALLAAQRWSFAGDPDRGEVNQLLMRGLIRRTLPENWFFISAPIITANWSAASGQKWLVPLGGGLGRSFKLETTRLNVSVQAYKNVVKPDGAPDYVARIGFTFPFRLPERQRQTPPD